MREKYRNHEMSDIIMEVLRPFPVDLLRDATILATVGMSFGGACENHRNRMMKTG